MPKARVERILSDDGTNKVVEVEVGERKKTKIAQYTVPSNASVWQSLVASLTDKPAKEGEESPLAYAYRMFVTSVDRTARMAVYESLAQESTVITVGKEKVDIMTFPVKRLVRAYNGNRERVMSNIFALAPKAFDKDDGVIDQAAYDTAEKTAERSLGFGPWRTAAKNLTEGYEDDNGARVAPVAKFTADGMLELLAA
jgi:hypothetical protein